MSEEETDTRSWFLRIASGVVFGPVPTKALRLWAEQGRVQPGNEISLDRKNWIPAPSLEELDIVWYLEDNQGNLTGPFNKRAAEKLIADGRVGEGTSIVHKDDADLAHLVRPAMENRRKKPAGGDPELDFGAEDEAALADENALRTECEGLRLRISVLEKSQKQLLAAAEKECKSHERQLEAERSKVSKLEAELEEARLAEAAAINAAKSVSTQQEAANAKAKGKVEAALEEVKAKYEADIAELEAKHKDELAAAEAKREAAIAQLEAKHKEELESSEAKREAAIAELKAKHQSELETADAKRKAAIAELEAKHKDELAAAESQRETDLAELEAKHKEEFSASDAALVEVNAKHKAAIAELATTHKDELAAMEAKHEAAVAGLTAKLEEETKKLEELQKEYSELLVFSNDRDAQAETRIAELSRRPQISISGEADKVFASEIEYLNSLFDEGQKRQKQVRERIDELVALRSGGLADAAERQAKMRAEKAAIDRSKEEINNLRLENARNVKHAEAREQELQRRIRLLEIELSQTKESARDADELRERIANLTDAVNDRDQIIVRERQERAAEHQQLEQAQQALLQRLETLEKPAAEHAETEKPETEEKPKSETPPPSRKKLFHATPWMSFKK